MRTSLDDQVKFLVSIPFLEDHAAVRELLCHPDSNDGLDLRLIQALKYHCFFHCRCRVVHGPSLVPLPAWATACWVYGVANIAILVPTAPPLPLDRPSPSFVGTIPRCDVLSCEQPLHA